MFRFDTETAADPAPYTQERLAERHCQVPGCDCDSSILYLRSQCHPDIPTWFKYDKEDGIITVECAQCMSTVAKFKVALD